MIDDGQQVDIFHDCGNRLQYFHDCGNSWYNRNRKGVVTIKYRDIIIEMVGKIRSEKNLKRIYKFVSYLYTHETGS